MPKTPKQASTSPKQEPIPDRGRYYDALQQGHSFRIREEDGTTTIQHYQLDEGTVMLDPDVGLLLP